MKLVADDNGRLACKSLFTPKRAFSAERQADGSIRLVELVEKEVPVVRARKVNGRWMGAEMQIDRAKVILSKLESDDTTVQVSAPSARPKKKITVAPEDDSQMNLL